MQDWKMALFVLGLWGMRNLIMIISVLFVAVIAVSFFYFSNLDQNDQVRESAGGADDEYPVDEEETVAGAEFLWAFDLNGGATTRPSVSIYDDSTYFVLVQDAYHILHAISPTGQKLWNAQLPGPILGTIQQLADRSLVFTTSDRLYRIDTEGDPLPGFSLQLTQKATQGAVVSSENEQKTRIDVPSTKRVLSYDGRGKLLGSQARNGQDGIRQGTDGQASGNDTADLPAGCGPLVYVGPLFNDSHRYLLCGKNDRKLYCYRYP